MKAWLWFVLCVLCVLMAFFLVPPMLSAQDTSQVIFGAILLVALFALASKAFNVCLDKIDW